MSDIVLFFLVSFINYCSEACIFILNVIFIKVLTDIIFHFRRWVFSNVTLFDNNALKIEASDDFETENRSRSYHLSSEWFIITPRPTTLSNCPPLPENKKQDGLFALTQPSEATIWILASSKYERYFNVYFLFFFFLI